MTPLIKLNKGDTRQILMEPAGWGFIPRVSVLSSR